MANAARPRGAKTKAQPKPDVPPPQPEEQQPLGLPPYEQGAKHPVIPVPGQLLAPRPLVDRYPIVLGAQLSMGQLANAMRLCTQGWRYAFVDLLSELFEHDPHARGCARQRTQTVAGGNMVISPASLPTDDPDEELADEIAEFVQASLDRVTCFSQSLHALAWGIIHGMSGAELMWEFADGDEQPWRLTHLQHIHSRRLNVPRYDSWDVYIWDQGSVVNIGLPGQTNGQWGLRIADYPGKFIVHTPQLSGEYSLRDGEGRNIASYMLLKRMVVRASAQDFERTIRPWALGYYNREHAEGQTEPFATQDDIATLNRALTSLGLGELNAAALPNSVKIELLRAKSDYKVQDFIAFLNAEESKGLLGQTFTTEPGKFGSKGTGQVGKEGLRELSRYDALCLSDSIERDIVRPLVALNYGEDAARRLLPRARISVDQPPDPAAVMELAVQATSIDIPVDIDELARKVDLPILAVDDEKGRRTRMVAAGKNPEPNGDDPNEGDTVTSDEESETEKETPPPPEEEQAAE